MTTTEKIRAEIERQLALNEDFFAASDENNEVDSYAKMLLCMGLLRFIDTLQGSSTSPQEPPFLLYVNDAAQDYVESKKNNWISTDAWDFVFEAFKAGAKWAYAKMKESE